MKQLLFIFLLSAIFYFAKAQNVVLSVHQPAPLHISAGSSVYNILLGENIELGGEMILSGGTSPYQISWSVSGLDEDLIEPTFTVSPLQSTIYTCTVTDANSCTQQQTFQVNVILPLQLEFFATDISCFGMSNGIIEMRITGGAMPFAINWDDGDTSSIRTNLSPGMYVVTVIDAMGQRRDASVILIESSKIEVVLNESICEDQFYLFDDSELTETGTYIGIFQSVTGCDSMVTLNLTVNPIYITAIDAEICEGKKYLFAGQELTQSGQYENKLYSTLGCDSLIVLNLTVNPAYNQSSDAVICQYETYFFSGSYLTQSGHYQDVSKTVDGCDSITNLNLTVNPVYYQFLDATICAGESYLFAGIERTESGEYNDSLKTITGCDSIIMLNLTVNAVSHEATEAAICQGESFLFSGKEYEASGTYTDSLKTHLGCDSILVLNLTVQMLPEIPVISQNKNTLISSLVEGNQWFKNGNEIYGGVNQTLDIVESGDYSVIVTNYAGCSTPAVDYKAVYTSLTAFQTVGLSCAIFPNPNNGLFTVEIESDKQEEIVLKLFSTDGKTIAQQQHENVPGRSSILFGKENIVKGVYSLQIITRSGILTRKLIVN
jgi:hypothetical protein